MIKDRIFYNKESQRYSKIRYPEIASNYVQFFFKKRLSILIKQLDRFLGHRNNLSLLEIGCADGVVLRAIVKNNSGVFSEVVGIDVAEDMISVAKSLSAKTEILFFLRDETVFNKKKFDVIVEIGVVNYTDFGKELEYVKENLQSGGLYVLSLAGNSSSNNFFGRGIGYSHLLSYQEYEQKIQKLFNISAFTPIGLYLPLIWFLPSLGGIFQSVVEFLFYYLLPNVFHEKIYVLTLK